jgi:hypothetical protein
MGRVETFDRNSTWRFSRWRSDEGLTRFVLEKEWMTPEKATNTMTATTIEPGVYTLQNGKSMTAITMSIVEGKPFIGWQSSSLTNPLHWRTRRPACHPFTGKADQQWEFSHLGDGFSIRNVAHGMYMSVLGHHNGAKILGSAYPVSWEVKFYQTDARCPSPNSIKLAVTLATRRTMLMVMFL